MRNLTISINIGHTSAYRSAPITSALACPPDLPTRPRAMSRLARPRRT